MRRQILAHQPGSAAIFWGGEGRRTSADSCQAGTPKSRPRAIPNADSGCWPCLPRVLESMSGLPVAVSTGHESQSRFRFPRERHLGHPRSYLWSFRSAPTVRFRWPTARRIASPRGFPVQGLQFPINSCHTNSGAELLEVVVDVFVHPEGPLVGSEMAEKAMWMVRAPGRTSRCETIDERAERFALAG